MTNFSEKIIRNISLLFLLLSVGLVIKNIYYFPLIIISLMVYFSTRGVQLFENDVFITTRFIFWLIFIGIIFFKMYYTERTSISPENVKTFISTIGIIAISLGIWVGDFFSKYIYVRLKFFINRLYSTSNKKSYRIVNIESFQQRYFKKPGKRFEIYFYCITLEIDGKEKKFSLEKEYYDKLKDKKTINIDIRKGILGMYYGIDLEEK